MLVLIKGVASLLQLFTKLFSASEFRGNGSESVYFPCLSVRSDFNKLSSPIELVLSV